MTAGHFGTEAKRKELSNERRTQDHGRLRIDGVDHPGTIAIDTPDCTIKFELNEDIALSICTWLEHFLTQEQQRKLNQAWCSR
jgi:hypothetical protein